MIPFNIPPFTGDEDRHVLESMRSEKICGGGAFSLRCQSWFEEHLAVDKALLTPSCTHALEMAALLMDLQPGDEVIMPSYTFVSTANAFVLRGAKIVFVDIRPDTMNMDETLIEAAITGRTKAIVPVHYAGVSCHMDVIAAIAAKHGLYIIEDAAQGMMSTYNGRSLGSIGHLGAFSFHETKNYTSGGEGGLLSIQDKQFSERAEIIREKGTNRSQFFRGAIDKYSWVDIGSSYLPSELQAAYLWAQLLNADKINENRHHSWSLYSQGLTPLRESGFIDLPHIPSDCVHNAHMFYIKAKDLAERSALIDDLKKKEIQTAFHYVPLHSSPAGLRYGRFSGADRFTTLESERLLRLPLWYGMQQEQISTVIDAITSFYSQKRVG